MGCNHEDTMNLNQLAIALTPLIPEDWELEIKFVKDEIRIDMYDPGGNRIEDWPDDMTTNEIALWYVNYARRVEGLPPGKVPGLAFINEHGLYEEPS